MAKLAFLQGMGCRLLQGLPNPILSAIRRRDEGKASEKPVMIEELKNDSPTAGGKKKMKHCHPIVHPALGQNLAIVAVGILWWMTQPAYCEEGVRPSVAINKVQLTKSHLEAAERQRRIILHHDITGPSVRSTPWVKPVDQLDEIVTHFMQPYESEVAEHVDSVFYEWGEGYPAMWPSKIVRRAKVEFPRWWAAGIDPVEVLVRETKKRHREVFFTYRLNGSDVEGDNEYAKWKLSSIKRQHRDWLIKAPWGFYYWDFTFQGVRDYKVSILREIAEMYDVDGLQIDFARNPIVLAIGQQWNNRGHLTNFMRQLRSMLEEVASQRGRPLLLAVRIPENIVGCHFDGIDVETWVGENLVDLLVPGCGAAEIDIPAFQRLVDGTHVKVYPSWDPIHPTEGYRVPEIEYWRGLYSKWWALGADGVHVFNLGTVPAVPAGISARQPGSSFNSTDAYSPILREIGDPEVMRFKDKVFFVERRTGMHGQKLTGDPENWTTPRHMYFLTYMLAPLPVPLANDGRADTLLTLTVTDDVHAHQRRVEAINLKILLSDSATESHDPTKFEVRINNLLLGDGQTEKFVRRGSSPIVLSGAVGGWLTYPVKPDQVAVGDNLVGIRVIDRAHDSLGQTVIEKLELHVKYGQDITGSGSGT